MRAEAARGACDPLNAREQLKRTRIKPSKTRWLFPEIFAKFVSIATFQGIAYLTTNQAVRGSNPLRRANQIKHLGPYGALFHVDLGNSLGNTRRR